MIKDNENGTFSIVPTIRFDTVSVEMPRHQWEAVMKALDVALYHTENKPKPLSDEEIHDIWKSLWEGGNIGHIAYNYARAIEERHGIK